MDSVFAELKESFLRHEAIVRAYRASQEPDDDDDDEDEVEFEVNFPRSGKQIGDRT